MRAFGFSQANTVEEALANFRAAGAGARYVAGGTTLYDLMKLGVERPSHLVDLTAVKKLSGIETVGDELRIGAMSLMSDVAREKVIREDYPVLAESLLKAASQQLRNMATVGGNVLQRTRCAYFRAGEGVYPCNKRNPGSGCSAIGGVDRGNAVLGNSDACSAVFPGDWPVALVALDAEVELSGFEGSRRLAVAKLHTLPGGAPQVESTLKSEEILTAIIIPKTTLGRASTYHKIRDRESYAFALASAAVALETEHEVIKDVRIALGGVATIPWRSHEAEDIVRNKRLTRELAFEAGRVAFHRARAGQHNAFKLELGAHVIADALTIALDRSGK